jgi:hypothetical protein
MSYPAFIRVRATLAGSASHSNARARPQTTPKRAWASVARLARVRRRPRLFVLEAHLLDEFDPLQTRYIQRGHPDFERVEAIAEEHGFRVVDLLEGGSRNEGGVVVGIRLALPDRATINIKKERALTRALSDAGIYPWSSLTCPECGAREPGAAADELVCSACGKRWLWKR